MSGFEVAGIVLGAFPVAISMIDGYRRLARKVDAWREIRGTYTRCYEDLKNEQLAFKRHLRLLVLPLVADADSAKALLEDPSGQRWNDAEISDLLKSKLGESHELYLGYVRRMQETLEELSKEMAIDSDLVQVKMAEVKPPPGNRLRSALTKDSSKFQAYKVKFIQGESTRRRLFKNLKDCNEKLWKLLDSSEKDTQLTKKLGAAQAASAVDASLCTFWKTATAFFLALAATCRCQCRETHAAKLLLQHRASCKEKARFEMVFTLQSTQGASSGWEACTTRIEEDDHGGFVNESIVLVSKRGLCQPNHRGTTLAPPTKLAIRPKTQKTGLNIPKVQFTPSVSLTAPSMGPLVPRLRPVRTLCQSLSSPEPDCRDYLELPDEDRRYYIYSVAQHPKMPTEVTLEHILNGDVKPSPTRRESYSIALILASSFLQFLESPWFPKGTRPFDKASIVFLADPSTPNIFLLHQPHIRRDFTALTTDDDGTGAINSSGGGSGTEPRAPSSNIGTSLARLGITLLELCFRAPLERQACRIAWGTGGSEREREGFDVLAAADWLTEVNDEAGPEYAGAVSWCLMGNRSVPADRWRGEMLREVVRPLQRCLDCFKLAGTGP